MSPAVREWALPIRLWVVAFCKYVCWRLGCPHIEAEICPLVYLWGPKAGSISPVALFLSFWDEVSHWSWSWPFRAGCLDSDPPGICLSPPPSPGVSGVHSYIQLFTGGSGDQNSSFRACAPSTSPAEPSLLPSPLYANIIRRSPVEVSWSKTISAESSKIEMGKILQTAIR